MKLLKTMVLAGAVSLVATVTSHAATLGIIGGETKISVTADLAGLGLTPSLTGTATTDGDALVFGITGGSVDTATDDALIEHDGSGVDLSGAGMTANISDFLIDTAAGTVSGSLNNVMSNVVFFTLGTSGPDGVQLLISNQLAIALTSVFMAPDLTGEEFGFAVPAAITEDISVVPLPAGLPLLAGGVLLLGAVRLRKTRMN